MATKIDPEIANLFSETLGARKYYAEPIANRAVTPSIRLDPQIVKKIADRVAIFSHMPQDALLATLGIGEVIPLRAGDLLFRGKRHWQQLLRGDHRHRGGAKDAPRQTDGHGHLGHGRVLW